MKCGWDRKIVVNLHRSYAHLYFVNYYTIVSKSSCHTQTKLDNVCCC